MTETINLQLRSDRNLVHTFRTELTQLEEGAVPREVLTDSQRRSLRKWGILKLDHRYNGRGISLTPYGRRLLEEVLE